MAAAIRTIALENAEAFATEGSDDDRFTQTFADLIVKVTQTKKYR